jgi:ubiquinone/menaquinone biosynthesis C-methylase UbiE
LPQSKVEGFNSQGPSERYTSKSNSDLYDSFYTKLYDSLVFSEQKNRFETTILKNVANMNSKSNVLDIGSGTGRHCSVIENIAHKCTGIDISKDMVDMSKKNAPKTTFIVGDALKVMSTQSNEYTHITVFYFTIYYMKDKLQFFKNAYHWLRPGGYIVVHLVNKHTFDPIIPAGDPLIMVSAQKYAKKRITNTIVKFNHFKYTADFSIPQNDIGNLDEKFIFKNGNVRHNKHTFYMDNQKSIINLAKSIGFILIAKVDMSKCQYDNQYLYILQKPS